MNMYADFDPENPYAGESRLEDYFYLTRLENEYMPAPYYFPNHMFRHRLIASHKIAQYLTRGQDDDNFMQYLAMNYYDRFISRKPCYLQAKSMKKVELIATCCLILALKLKRSRLSLDQLALVLCLDQEKIDEKKQMQLEILRELKCLMRPITPLAFLNLFIDEIQYLDAQTSGYNVKQKAVEYIYILNRSEKLNRFRPSLIAASAVLTAWSRIACFGFIRINKAKMNLTASGFLKIDALDECMDVMKGGF